MNDRALKVLEQYDLEVITTRRGRGSYICETDQGLRILCDYPGSESKALFENRVMEKIREGGYEKVDRILPNREGSLISRDWEDNKYVVKEWYVGRECDTSSETEILAAVENLARLHRLMHLEDTGEGRIFSAPDPLREIKSCNGELKKIRTFIRRKNTKCEFERLFLSGFPRYFDLAVQAEKKLEEECLVFGGARDQRSVCHGDYNHHHVLMCGYDIATTSFESCRFDIQINDLYRFMRKILEKHDWNQRLGMRMLEQYRQIRPITVEEQKLLYVRMLYPEKFRKLANHYYGSRKTWVSGRFLEKLKILEEQEEKKNNFVKLLER